jgi:hypothetical protein
LDASIILDIDNQQANESIVRAICAAIIFYVAIYTILIVTFMFILTSVTTGLNWLWTRLAIKLVARSLVCHTVVNILARVWQWLDPLEEEDMDIWIGLLRNWRFGA